MEYDLAIKDWNLAICSKDRPGGYCAEWNKSDTEKTKSPDNFTYLWNLKQKKQTSNRNSLIATENILTVARWKGLWGNGHYRVVTGMWSTA